MAAKGPVTGEPLAKFLEIDARCWKAAIQIHNRELPGGNDKPHKYYIPVEGDNLTVLGGVVCKSPVASTNDLVKAAETAYQKSAGKRGKGAKVFYSIVSCFQMYSKAIDVFIQQEPRTTALIWGTIRILLQAAVDSEEASELTANGILLIAQHAGRWAKIGRCFGYEHSVEEALTDLYVQVLGFLLPAIHHLHKRHWAILTSTGLMILNLAFSKTGEITLSQCERSAQHKACHTERCLREARFNSPVGE
ncbi:hypothetical protein CDV36_015592 [Fusarium kuroshium]|uniref:DUF7708 domain-containing protein n=1 Tax=Fusarium kuroshium TaxID=2010991 RepID=A0A3M2R9B4_9HYPO|nr:hypothetical protein CDV36_015592 [Fusarium kuroshium]